MGKKSTRIGLALLVVLAALPAGAVAIDSPQQTAVEENTNVIDNGIVLSNDCPVEVQSGISTECSGGGGSVGDPCYLNPDCKYE